jgi:hypothetical protein
MNCTSKSVFPCNRVGPGFTWAKETAATQNASARVFVDELVDPLPHISGKIHHTKWTRPFRVSGDTIRTTHGASGTGTAEASHSLPHGYKRPYPAQHIATPIRVAGAFRTTRRKLALPRERPMSRAFRLRPLNEYGFASPAENSNCLEVCSAWHQGIF